MLMLLQDRACSTGSKRTRAARIFGLAVSLALAVSTTAATRADAQGYSVIPLTFKVKVGPGHAQTCEVVSDLYRPDDATAQHRDPAVLMTNGLGGSDADLATLGEELAANGYVTLAYSGLGFGGSGCPIEDDTPAWDGEAASQLVTFLGGGSAASNGTRVDYVTRQAVARNGVRYKYDPRVGMYGGSYGGEVQFAAADVDPRIDTIIPLATWNNLAYSLAPNNAYLPNADSVTSAVPGDTKAEWLSLIGAVGGLSGLENPTASPPGAVTQPCPDSPTSSCEWIVQMLASGYPDATSLAYLHNASVASYMKNIRIPVMLMQGEDDTLFTLHEAVATYAALRAQGTPVKMVWQSWGHSDGTPVAGEAGPSGAILDAQGHMTVEGQMILQWFNHYLKGDKLAPPLDFSFYRPWVKGNAFSAYASAPSYPIGTDHAFYLSGSSSLTTSRAAVSSGSSSFATPPAGAPTSVTEVSDLSQTVPLVDPPGTYAAFESTPLKQTTDVVGIPTVKLHVSAPVTSLSSPYGYGGDLTLFFKLEDIAPDGTATLPDRLIAPARFTSDGTVEVSLPGIVHRFPAGDRLKLIVAGSDSAYRGGLVSTPVTISTDPSNPGVLNLPVATSSSYGPVQFASDPTVACHSSRTITIAFSRKTVHEGVRSGRVEVNGRLRKRVRAGARSVRVSLSGVRGGRVRLTLQLHLRNGHTVLLERVVELCSTTGQS